MGGLRSTPDPLTPGPDLVDGIDVEAVATAVRACAGVSDLYAGRFGEIGTYLPGRRVAGVRVDDRTVTVHLRVRWGYLPGDVLAQVIAVTAPLRGGRRLDVVVDDIDVDVSTRPAASTRPVAADEPAALVRPLEIEPATSTSVTHETSPS